jgi:hypothetical protein
MFWPVFSNVGLASIAGMICRHIRYVGLTKLIHCAGTGVGQITHLWVKDPTFKSEIGLTVLSWTRKSTEGSHPYNQGENLPRHGGG